MKRIGCAVLALCMVLALFPAAALADPPEPERVLETDETAYLQAYVSQFTTGWSNWNLNYTFTGDPAQDIVNIARAQIGKNGSTLNYNTEWCAMFVVDCAIQVGATNAIPPESGNGYVPTLYNSMRGAGAEPVSISDARPGDIAFINWDRISGVNNLDHVEIVSEIRDGKVYTVGGNTRNGDPTLNWYGIRIAAERNVQASIIYILRPNYGYAGEHVHQTVGYGYQTLGQCVRELQEALKQLVNADLIVDGQFGPLTYDALIYYQSIRHLRLVDGICGGETWAAIERDLYGTETPADIDSGFYATIINPAAQKVLTCDNSDSLTVRTGNGHTLQTWYFVRQYDGSYTVQLSHDWSYLTNDNGTLRTADYNGCDNQHWFLYEENGAYFLQPADNASICLDVYGGGASATEGNAVCLYEKIRSDAQYFSIVKVTFLDLNGWLDGQENSNTDGYGTFDVIVIDNGTECLMADDVSDYYRPSETGLYYRINDIRAADGKQYNGVYSGSLEGWFEGTDVEVVLDFSTLPVENPPSAPFRYGDVNGDGSITEEDVNMINNAFLYDEPLTGSRLTAADVNGDGEANTLDSQLILQYMRGAISSFPVEQTSSFRYGDVNGDGSITEEDVHMITNAILEEEPLTGNQLTAADVNGDGTANTLDSQLILQYIQGAISSFPVEQTSGGFNPDDFGSHEIDNPLVGGGVNTIRITGARRDGYTITATYTGSNPSASVICAAYDSADRLVSVSSTPMTSTHSCSFQIYSTFSSAKVFILDGGLHPLCRSVTAS